MAERKVPPSSQMSIKEYVLKRWPNETPNDSTCHSKIFWRTGMCMFHSASKSITSTRTLVEAQRTLSSQSCLGRDACITGCTILPSVESEQMRAWMRLKKTALRRVRRRTPASLTSSSILRSPRRVRTFSGEMDTCTVHHIFNF